jgi:hypothetical protein
LIESGGFALLGFRLGARFAIFTRDLALPIRHGLRAIHETAVNVLWFRARFLRCERASRFMLRPVAILLLLATLLLGTGCEQVYYSYHYVPGHTALLRGGYAFAPPGAPPQVEAAIAAGNRIVGLPYRYGGGHGTDVDTAYDCSGTASFVLRGAGLVRGCMVSKEFRDFGEPGEGEWINVYAKNGHVFLAVAGLRLDTGWTDGSEGPQWTMIDRPASGCVLRHPEGL